MGFNLYEQTLTFKELESVLKHDLVKLKERFLDDILESEEGGKPLYDLKEMSAAIRTHEEVLILIYDYINSREELRKKRKEENKE